ncbi:MAG: glutamate--tRNA ligase [Anaerolineae bacterium]|nr:glutamate--tRNA ligase [Anaerolineae bacterium]MDW8099800.1 glutamate--tRNA ligase [Anaerolineae bacterium]
MTSQPVRVRMAPSPTGYFHLGSARTALFNWLYARHTGGRFILRIEDTDRTRYHPEALADILASLRWLSLDWDEGPEVGGDYGPYFQSQRLPIYQEYARKLVAEGHAYYCYCSEERLTALREEQRKRKQPIGYDRHCRHLTAAQRAEYEAQGIVPVIRLKVPDEGEITFHDLIRGEITVDVRTLDDLVLLKSDGFPTYHLANVVDDHLMEITHILRGDEWLSSVPRHILLYRAFGWEPPAMAHLPLLLDPSGKGKMSKRKPVVDGVEYPTLIRDFRQEGYLPEAMFNFLALLGWSYDPANDLFTREQAIERFDIVDINPKPSVVSYSKLEWMNGVYIRQLSIEELTRRLVPFLAKGLGLTDEEVACHPGLPVLVPAIQERLKKLSDAAELVDFAFREPGEYDPQRLIGQKMTAAESLEALRAAREALATLPEFAEGPMETALRELAERLGVKAGALFGILRVAITGKQVAPPLFASIVAVGRERTLARCDRAIRLLEQLL